MGAVTLDAVSKRPALLLEFLVLLEVDAVLRNDGDGVGVQAPCVAVVKHLHALLDGSNSVLLGKLLSSLLIRDNLSQDRNGDGRAEARGKRRRRVSSTAKVSGREERATLLVKAADEDVVPEWIELVAAGVEELGEVAVEIGGGEARRGGGGCGRGRVGLLDLEVVEVAGEVLHVGDVAAEADDGGAGEGEETLDVGEAGEGAV